MRVAALLLLALGLTATASTAQYQHAQPAPAVAAVVPYYGATYTPPGAWTRDDVAKYLGLLEAQNAILGEIRDELRAGRAGGPVPQAAKKGPDMLATAKARCAACHTPSKSDASGGGFILFADDARTALRPLSTRDRANIKRAVLEGTMPPSKPLSAAEKAAFE